MKITKRKIKCIDTKCPGFFELIENKEYYFCDNCKLSSLEYKDDTNRKIIYSKNRDFSTDFSKEISADKLGSLDLVLVSPRHLFRAPYSLHEKTALASVVIHKNKINDFSLKDADPMTVTVYPFYQKVEKKEASFLLESALNWKKNKQYAEDKKQKYKTEIAYSKIDMSNVTEDMYPIPIKKLLQGLKDGKKRGLFVLITFFRSLNMANEMIEAKIYEWNKKNNPPLKEGYIKSQLNWHFKQGRKIMPPNYDNSSFYKDLGLIDKMPDAKNPLVEVIRHLKHKKE